MDIQTGFFYLFSAVLLFSAFRVVTARNPVHAVLFLMLAFSQAAGIWLLLKVEFLAIMLLLVYLGAVMVLFLFVVMMLDINIDSVRKGFWRHFPLALGIGALIAFEMAAVLAGGFGVSQAPEMQATLPGVHAGNAKMLGGLLYTQYLYPIQIAAVILLVAMIAAITLTLRERKTTKKIDPAIQVRARAADRLVVVSMQATQMAAPEVAPEENAQAPAAEAKK